MSEKSEHVSLKAYFTKVKELYINVCNIRTFIEVIQPKFFSSNMIKSLIEQSYHVIRNKILSLFFKFSFRDGKLP